MIWIVFGSMLLAIAALLIFIPKYPACIAAYAGMWLALRSGMVFFSGNTMIFWGMATAIALAIRFLLPRPVALARQGVGFISGGALTGMALGMAFGSMPVIITAAVCGAFFGSLAYANTPAGRSFVAFPSGRFFNYLGAKGLPAVVTVAMIGAVLVQLLTPAAQ